MEVAGYIQEVKKNLPPDFRAKGDLNVLHQHTLSACQGLSPEGRESSPNTRMIRRGRFSDVVDSSMTPA